MEVLTSFQVNKNKLIQLVCWPASTLHCHVFSFLKGMTTVDKFLFQPKKMGFGVGRFRGAGWAASPFHLGNFPRLGLTRNCYSFLNSFTAIFGSFKDMQTVGQPEELCNNLQYIPNNNLNEYKLNTLLAWTHFNSFNKQNFTIFDLPTQKAATCSIAISKLTNCNYYIVT